ncbi:MAG TPA: type II toxin-antitoxin system VapC family toxin [Rhodothermia bacterium]|nr:type II toxin-antitoxin system VapC family toxin [Rhodothermia bacterium]
MIVADASLLAYLHIQGDRTADAEAALRRDPVWAAPRLWRSEMRNVLILYVRKGVLAVDEARLLMDAALDLMRGNEYEVASDPIFACLERANVSAYDAEYVALATELDIHVVTADRRLQRAFPERVVSLREFASGV